MKSLFPSRDGQSLHQNFISTYLIGVMIIVAVMTSSPTRANAYSEALLAARKVMDEGITSQNKHILIKARAQFEQMYRAKSDENALYYLTYTECWLSLLGVSRGGDPTLVDIYLDNAIEHAELLTKRNPSSAEPKVILATLYGIRLKSNALNLIIVGPRIEELINEAVALEPNNPRVLYVQGNSFYYKPAIFGGGVRKALETLKRAQFYFEKELAQTKEGSQPETMVKHTWGYLETLSVLGKCYEEVSDWENARATYKRGLALKPNYKWIKYELLPNLEEKYPEKRAEK